MQYVAAMQAAYLRSSHFIFLEDCWTQIYKASKSLESIKMKSFESHKEKCAQYCVIKF